MLKYLQPIIMIIIWVFTVILFKTIDWIGDKIVQKTAYKKAGIKKRHKVRYFVSRFFGNKENVSSEVFDDIVIQWGVSRDFLLFKKEIGTLTDKEKSFLKKWEGLWQGKKPKNSEELYDDKTFNNDVL
jgi:hypothetical protein